MIRTIKPGRYVLDPDGKLHPLRRRYWVRAVAIVTARPLCKTSERVPQGTPTADHAGGCEGRAAEREPTKVILSREPDVPNRPAADRRANADRIQPGNARQPRKFIDLAAVPSSLEQRADAWRGNR